jgi:hypothetical protein
MYSNIAQELSEQSGTLVKQYLPSIRGVNTPIVPNARKNNVRRPCLMSVMAPFRTLVIGDHKIVCFNIVVLIPGVRDRYTTSHKF